MEMGEQGRVEKIVGRWSVGYVVKSESKDAKNEQG